MKIPPGVVVTVGLAISGFWVGSNACAAVYNAAALTSISVSAGGEVFIRFDGIPDPGPCGGENNHWVVIPSAANEALKALAISLYFSSRPVRVDTSGCTGSDENVTTIYSPSGG